MTEQVTNVAGPSESSEGFIRDFLAASSSVIGDFTPGDFVNIYSSNIPLSCPGYTIAPVMLRACEKAPENEDEWPHMRFDTTVILSPEDGTPPPSASGPPIKVEGLVDKDLYPLSFTAAPDDPLASFISYDSGTGDISLEVSWFMYGYYSWVEMRNCIYTSDTCWAESIMSSFLQDVWDKHQFAPVTEGVFHKDEAVPAELSLLLNMQIGKLAAAEPVDWQPRSRDGARDLLHPFLSFVCDESDVEEGAEALFSTTDAFAVTVDKENPVERWGRKIEPFGYRWLPSFFRTTARGAVTIEGCIYELDKTKYCDLYNTLARLFEVFLPRFEKVYAYLRAVKILTGVDGTGEGLVDIDREYSPNLQESRLRDMSLRVIIRIVDYELKTDTDFVDGVFHVVKSDHIIMIGIYIVDRDSDFRGGVLEFRRLFLRFEKSAISEGLSLPYHWRVSDILREHVRPLGALETPKGRMIVFPNSHIHRFSRMTRDTAAAGAVRKDVSRRRAVVFWVLDPERDVATDDR